MKMFSVVFFVTAVFVAGSNGGSPSGIFGMSSSSMLFASSSASPSSSSMMDSASSSMAESSSMTMMGSSSSSDAGICYIVAQVIYEFNAFTSNIMKMYISNFHRSDDSTIIDKSEKLTLMVETVESHNEVPAGDKEKLRELYELGNTARSLTDQFTHENIWDCFVGIFTGALSGVLAP